MSNQATPPSFLPCIPHVIEPPGTMSGLHAWLGSQSILFMLQGFDVERRRNKKLEF